MGLTGRAQSQAHARGEGTRLLLVPAGFLHGAWSLKPACRDKSVHTSRGQQVVGTYIRGELKRRFLEPGAARRTHTQARRMKRRKSRSFRRGTPHSVVGACHAFSARLKVSDICGRLSYTPSLNTHTHTQQSSRFFCIRTVKRSQILLFSCSSHKSKKEYDVFLLCTRECCLLTEPART